MAAKRNDSSKKDFSIYDKASTPDFQCNSITPGTPFMFELNKALKYYICQKL